MTRRQAKHSTSRQLIDAIHSTNDEDVLHSTDISSVSAQEIDGCNDSDTNTQANLASGNEGNLDINLFQYLCGTKEEVSKAVDDWINLYHENTSGARVLYINALFELCGCNFSLPEAYINLEIGDLVEAAAETAKNGGYPIVSAEFPNLKVNICYFVEKLIERVKYSILFGDFLLNELISFLGLMANSPIRGIRHTACLLVLKTMTCIVKPLSDCQSNLESLERSYNAVQSKNPNSSRCRSLRTSLSQLEQQVQYLKNVISTVIKTVIAQRSLDPCLDIKLLCLHAISRCILSYPQEFLVDNNLKYVFRFLLDSNTSVRLQTMKLIESLYSKPEFKHELHIFSDKLKRVLLRMCNAPTTEIRFNSIRILTKLNEMFEDSLSDEDKAVLFKLTLSKYAQIAIEAGALMQRCYFHTAVDCSNSSDLDLIDEINEANKDYSLRKSQQNTAAGDAIRNYVASLIKNQPSVGANSNCIHILAQLIDYVDLKNSTPYIIDGLWKSNEMLRDWTALVWLLLQESADSEDNIVTLYTEILSSCVERATTGKATIKRERPKSVKLDSATVQRRHREKMSRIMIPAFPLLLECFASDREKLLNLLKLPLYFDLSMYTTSREERCMTETVRCLLDIIHRHSTTDVLDALSKALTCYWKFSPKCSTAFLNLTTSLAESLSVALKELVRSEWALGDDNHNIWSIASVCLRKLAAIFLNNDLTKLNLHKASNFILTAAAEGRIPLDKSDMIESAAKISYASILYMTDQFTNEPGEQTDTVKSIEAIRDRVLNLLTSILGNEIYGKASRSIYVTLCDLLVLFSPVIPDSKPRLSHLVVTPSLQLQDLLVGYINGVFRKSVYLEDDSAADSQSTSSDVGNQMSENRKMLKLEESRYMFAYLFRLIQCRQLEIRSVVPAVRYFYTCREGLGDLFRAVFSYCRDLDQQAVGQAFHDGLVGVYLSGMRKLGNDDYFHDCPEIAMAHKLAFCLAQSLGVDCSKIQEFVMTIHVCGIRFALQGRNKDGFLTDLAYFDILRYFLPKLLVADRRVVFKQFVKLVKASEPFNFLAGEASEAYKRYESSLNVENKKTFVAPRKKPIYSPSISEGSQIIENEGSASKKRKSTRSSVLSSWSSPPLHSTAIRGKGRKILEERSVENDLEHLSISSLNYSEDSPAKRLRSRDLGVTRKKIAVFAEDEDLDGFEPLDQEDDNVTLGDLNETANVENNQEDEDDEFTQAIEEFSASPDNQDLDLDFEIDDDDSNY